MWFYFALATSLFWGIGQILTKKGFTHITPMVSVIVYGVISLFLFLPISLAMGVNFNLIAQKFPLVLLISLMYVSYVYALNKGQVSLTGTVLSTYPLVTIILARIFLLEQTSLFQKLAILFVFAGLIFVSLPSSRQNTNTKLFHPWLVWALTAALLIGTADFMAKVVINHTGISTFLFMQGITEFLAGIVLFIFDKPGRVMPNIKPIHFIPTLIGLFLLQLGTVTFNFGFSFGTATMVTTVASAYTVISLILAVVFLKEKLTQLQFTGVIAVIFGIILTGIT